jgi:hypothetical protein
VRLEAIVVAFLLHAVAAAAQAQPGLLPQEPNSAERWKPIEALKSASPGLASAFATRTHNSPSGERMPYRLFTPVRLEPGRRYPLIVFLHGAGGSGTDNQKQLQGANMFGALVWTLPEYQRSHLRSPAARHGDSGSNRADLELPRPDRQRRAGGHFARDD